MAQYILFSDSTTDLLENFFEENHVEVVSLSYMIDGVEHMDDLRSESKKEFFDKMRSGSRPVTSQVNVEQFIDRFSPFMEQNLDLVYIAFSSGLSGTYNSAVIAKQMLEERYPERHIYVVDSLCASLGEGLFFMKVVEMRDKGLTASELAQWAEDNKLLLHHWFTVDNLEYLRRGGRVSATAAFVGTLLSIKPALNMNSEGKLIPRDRVKGRKKAITYMFDRFMEFATDKTQLIGISHGDCLEDAKTLEAMIRNVAPVKDVIITNVGTVIGSHSGPGTLALFFFGPERVV